MKLLVNYSYFIISIIRGLVFNHFAKFYSTSEFYLILLCFDIMPNYWFNIKANPIITR